MGVIGRLNEKRHQQILLRARPHLEEDEEILLWVRARHPGDGRNGILFLTETRTLVRWSGRKETGHQSFMWAEIRTWGLDKHARGGPILEIHTDDDAHSVQMLALTRNMADDASEALREFVERAPWPKESLRGGEPPPQPAHPVSVEPHKRSVGEMTKRVLVTILGIAMIIVAFVIIPLPGPWSFFLNIGGLAILATEYDWAQDLMEWVKEKYEKAKKKVASRRSSRPK